MNNKNQHCHISKLTSSVTSGWGRSEVDSFHSQDPFTDSSARMCFGEHSASTLAWGRPPSSCIYSDITLRCYSVSPKPWSQNKTPDSRKRANKVVSILWTGKNTTQWSFTEAATHAASVYKIHVGLWADFTHVRTHTEVCLAQQRERKVKRKAGRWVDGRENNCYFK